MPPRAVWITDWKAAMSIFRRASSPLSGVISRYLPPMTLSAKAERVPGTSEMAASMSRAMVSISVRSSPVTLMPMGVRTPVETMSMRILIG